MVVMVPYHFLVNLTYKRSIFVVSKKFRDRKPFRKGKDLARSQISRKPYEVVYIICEGETEYYYFLELIKFYRLNTVKVIMGKGSAPISIVEHAIEIGQNNLGVDRIFYVFDKDKHESYNRAIRTLRDYKSNAEDKNFPEYVVITSTPCFEIWLLLHFEYSSKPYDSADILNVLKKKIPEYNKGTAHGFNFLILKIDAAISNSQRLKRDNQRTGALNPDTNMHELIIYLKDLKN